MLKISPNLAPLEKEFGPVVQLAYHSPDIEVSAKSWAHKMNAGPFYRLSHIKLAESYYRGSPAPFDHSSAYGQCGSLMVELIHQHDDRPSAVRDMFAAEEEGLHHAAIFVDDLATALSKAGAHHFECALDARTADGVRFVMVDARAACGHMLELYERNGALDKFYAFIRRKAEGWNGENWLREITA
ncbi:VOC family protein [Hyphococcus sp.]|uniref:VOC family protein n=1 Tax=Hyphococcus sp. TaxID=2038636 RepID=UPI003CCB948E